jgi:putative sigma-54 modulation protein
MEIKIRGEKMKITDAMKDYVEEKLGKLDKYLEKSNEVKANVIVKVKGHLVTVEITIPLKSFILRSEETQEDFYAAVDLTIDKLERQVRKNKTRLMSMKNQNKKSYDFNFESIEFEKEEKETNKIVKRKTIEVKPMNEEEAILQMELLGHQFYMFKDSDTDKAAVVYKRNDGNYGVIESE